MNRELGTIKPTEGLLDIVLRDKVLFSQNLLKLNLLTNENKKLNLFVEGDKNVTFFNELKPNTHLLLASFETKHDYSLLKSHIPECLNVETIALANSDFKFYLQLEDQFPPFKLSYNKSMIDITQDLILRPEILESLYISPAHAQNSPERHPSEKYLDLQRISEKVRNASILASNWAVIVDCCDSYNPKPASAQDYLVTYKITDPSIFPDNACVNIFHKDSKEVPKIANFGDIVFFNSIQFNGYKETTQGVIATNARSMTYHIFDYKGKDQTSYADFKASFIKDEEHAEALQNLRNWVSSTFETELPKCFLNSTKQLKDLTEIDKEYDVIAKIVKVFRIGVSIDDNILIVLASGDQVSQLIIPYERKKLLKWAREGDVIKIRSVFCEGNILFMSNYTEILKFSFNIIQVPVGDVQAQVEYIRRAFGIGFQDTEISTIDDAYNRYPLCDINTLKNLEAGTIVVIRVYVVSIKIKKNTRVVVWDGYSDLNKAELFIQDKDLRRFLNGNEVKNVKDYVCGHNKIFNAVVRIKEDRIEISHTRLRNQNFN